MRQELEASRHYLDSHGSCFWDDLVAAEMKTGERYLGKIGRTHWMTAFAPMGVAGDVLAVLEGARSTLELNSQDLLDIAAGLVKVIAAYDKNGDLQLQPEFFYRDENRRPLPFSPALFTPHLLQPETGHPGRRRPAQPFQRNPLHGLPGGDQSHC